MTPRPQFTMRMDERTERLLERLVRELNLDRAGVVRLALVRLAKTEGVQDEQ